MKISVFFLFREVTLFSLLSSALLSVGCSTAFKANIISSPNLQYDGMKVGIIVLDENGNKDDGLFAMAIKDEAQKWLKAHRFEIPDDANMANQIIQFQPHSNQSTQYVAPTTMILPNNNQFSGTVKDAYGQPLGSYQGQGPTTYTTVTRPGYNQTLDNQWISFVSYAQIAGQLRPQFQGTTERNPYAPYIVAHSLGALLGSESTTRKAIADALDKSPLSSLELPRRTASDAKPGCSNKIGVSWLPDPTKDGSFKVVSLTSGGAAEKAKLLVNDRVNSANGKSIKRYMEEALTKAGIPKQETVILDVDRDGTNKQIKLIPGYGCNWP